MITPKYLTVEASPTEKHRRILPRPMVARKVLVARAWIHVVAKWERDQFCRKVYSIETLLHTTCPIISELKHPRYCFPKFVSIWPAPEVVDGIFEVCPPATKFCPLVNKPVALGFSLWWQIFDINKQFCPLVRLGPHLANRSRITAKWELFEQRAYISDSSPWKIHISVNN